VGCVVFVFECGGLKIAANFVVHEVFWNKRRRYVGLFFLNRQLPDVVKGK
jgi:hypothetical protein